MEEISLNCELVRVWHELVQLQGESIMLVQHQEFQVPSDAICSMSIVRFLRLDTLCESGQVLGFRLDRMHEVFGMKTFQEGVGK